MCFIPILETQSMAVVHKVWRKIPLRGTGEAGLFKQDMLLLDRWGDIDAVDAAALDCIAEKARRTKLVDGLVD